MLVSHSFGTAFHGLSEAKIRCAFVDLHNLGFLAQITLQLPLFFESNQPVLVPAMADLTCIVQGHF